MKLRAPYNFDPDSNSEENGLRCEDPSLTIQSQAEEADINVIVRRFGLTGALPQVQLPPEFGDFTEVTDFRDAMDRVRAAEESFAALPAEIRARFAHDPAAFIDFATAKENLPELRKLGLAVPEAPASDPAPNPSPAG